MTWTERFSIAAMLLTAAIVTGARLIGPGDLYDKDQPKTIAYTADMLVHGRYALPRDVIYQPATKPPLYNWISAIVVEATGAWEEWSLKMPSLLATLGTGAVVFTVARRLHPDRSVIFASLAAAIWFSFGSDVRHGSVIRLSYLARPDMLQCFFLTAAWASVTRFATETQRHRVKSVCGVLCASVSLWPILFWVGVTAALLTKGPAAALVVVFAVVHSTLTTRRFAWVIGAIIPAVAGGAWLWFAYQQDPTHVKQTILGAEIVGRVTDESPEGIAKPFYFSAMWFVTKTLPWGLLAIAGVVLYAVRRRSDPWMTPAVLWLGIVLVALSVPAGKRMDYLLPAYPPAAVLVAYVLTGVGTLRFASRPTPALPVLVAIGVAYVHLTRFEESEPHATDRTVAFVRKVRPIIGTDETIVIVRGKHPITTLLGRHHGSYLTPADLARAKWFVLPEQPGWAATASSEPVPVGFESSQTRPVARIGLYPADGVDLDAVIAMQRRLGEWNREENPYHAPGTVYRDTGSGNGVQ